MTITPDRVVDDLAEQIATGRIAMTPGVAALLRAPFAAEHMGKLPKITCGGCRGSKSRPNPQKVCGDHRKIKCPQCRNWITDAHMHLDYVGHAEVTDRLITVDPTWSWEPLAFDDDGLPKFDHNGALWIRLTVAGKPMLGYGSADGKTGGDAVKEIIGDAIRNAAMRFGVALDLWGATFKAAEDDAEAAVRESAPDVADEDWENATPVHGRGVAPAAEEQPRPAARPVSKEAPGAAYKPELYPLGVQRIEQAKTNAELDQMANNIPVFESAGQITAAEAGRLRMKLADARDILRQPAPADSAQQAAETTTSTEQESAR